jgi:hypothetical protein
MKVREIGWEKSARTAGIAGCCSAHFGCYSGVMRGTIKAFNSRRLIWGKNMFASDNGSLMGCKCVVGKRK